MTEPALRFPVGTIRRAIKELMQGELGSLRSIPQGTFKYGRFDGQPLAAEQATSLDTGYGRNYFDVQAARVTRNRSTQFSAFGSYRVANLPITITITTALSTTVEETDRDDVLEAVIVDLEQAAAALGYPGNLATDVEGADTAIIGECLVGPDEVPDVEYEAVPRWDDGLVRSRITGLAIVQIAQEVA